MWVEPREYDPERDRAALELFALYNATANGGRLLMHRKHYLFRRLNAYLYPG